MKVFISQPMRGKTDQQIYDERWEVIKEIVSVSKKELFPNETIHILNTVFDFAPGTHPLIYLAESIRVLSEADKLVMMPGWELARGCVIEHECAVRYGIPIYYLDRDNEDSIEEAFREWKNMGKNKEE